ncbi:hypothetical protein [Komagataeibacter sp. FNDCR2]|uniref:hypothetical protein n=1 Tax=Komagataeibacter sp. FNDCR2 TaxID=2878682 RepID=UPI001E308E6D|nr:hypothetical protein [Komagataeibacter sp. FNDCR2]MCE2574373.1 hypothetical protein [Komagataeibacter sp. FNDCR2]
MMVAYQGSDVVDPPFWLATPEHDFTELAHIVLPEAENLLATQGVFAPFGAVMDLRGGIARVTPPLTMADPAAQLTQVQAALRDSVRTSPRRAAAVIANCTVILPGGKAATQAAVVMCAYRDGSAAQIAYPYTLVNGRVMFAQPAWDEGMQDIFPPIRLRPYVREACPPRPAGYAVGLFMVHGLDPAEILQRLGLKNAGAGTDMPTARQCIAPLPGGWCVLWCNDMADATALRARIAILGTGADVIVTAIDEHTYSSCATAHHNGVEIWSVTHDGGIGPHDLKTSGQPPTQLANLVAEMEKEEVESGYPPGAVDFYFDIPVALVHALTGFSYCQPDSAQGHRVFTPLMKSASQA